MSYITKTNLSLGPQFGSQMTQYAGLYAISKHLGAEIVFLEKYMQLGRGVRLFDAFELPDKIISHADIEFSSFVTNDMLFDNRVMSLDPSKNWDIGGWFHTYQYFDAHRKDLCNLFKFKEPIYNNCTQKLNYIRNDSEAPLVSVHFRRGDYLEVSSLNLSMEYYAQAINIFVDEFPDFKLLVFSDDIEWCKNNILGEYVHYTENTSMFEDMCLMSLCDHNIIANSSFSWWASYLNETQNKMVVCPQDYIGSSSPSHQFMNGNYYPSDWIALPLH